MKKNINFDDFCNEFVGSQYENNFTHEGKRALFDYLEEYEQSTGEEINLDIVAICCDFKEYADIEEIKANYNMIKNIDDLYKYTQVIEFDGGFIIQKF